MPTADTQALLANKNAEESAADVWLPSHEGRGVLFLRVMEKQ
jgi:hypothetical protein